MICGPLAEPVGGREAGGASGSTEADESGVPGPGIGVSTNSDIFVSVSEPAEAIPADSGEEQAMTATNIRSSGNSRYPVNVDAISVFPETWRVCPQHDRCASHVSDIAVVRDNRLAYRHLRVQLGYGPV